MIAGMGHTYPLLQGSAPGKTVPSVNGHPGWRPYRYRAPGNMVWPANQRCREGACRGVLRRTGQKGIAVCTECSAAAVLAADLA
jgi:hypothetical protein